MEANALLIAARFIHYAAALLLFGLCLFPIYARSDWTAPLRAASLAALFASLAWFALSVASMAGDLSAATDPASLRMVLTSMAFGQAWGVRFLLLVAIAAMAFAPASRPRTYLMLLTTGLHLASLSLSGHTQLAEGAPRAVHVIADGLHLLAAGAWLGGLVGLAAVLPRHDPEVGFLLNRFSRMGYCAVGVVVATGVVNGLFLVGGLQGLFGSDYGSALLIKVTLVGGMVGMALINRFWLSPPLRAPATAEAATPWIARLRRSVLAEQTLGFAVLAAVSVLGTLEPPS